MSTTGLHTHLLCKEPQKAHVHERTTHNYTIKQWISQSFKKPQIDDGISAMLEIQYFQKYLAFLF